MRTRFYLTAFVFFGIVSPASAAETVIVAPENLAPLEQYALSELADHVANTFGSAPRIVAPGDSVPAGALEILFGRIETNPRLASLAAEGAFRPNRQEQGFAIHVPQGDSEAALTIVLCGADEHGLLWAVRDFSHFHLYSDGGKPVIEPANVSFAPVIKCRQISESGCNLYECENPHEKFMFTCHFNRDTTKAEFAKKYYVDWLSEWKINVAGMLWCNYPVYDEAYADFVRYAHSRGVKVVAFMCPFRPGHEKPPGEGLEAGSEGAGDCPRDPENRRWYFNRLVELITREPLVDGICLETPEHDGIACPCPECRKNPYPGVQMLNELVAEIKKHRPDLPISFSLKEPTPNREAAEAVLKRLIPLDGPHDWYSNSYVSRDDRAHWHAVSHQCGTYLRPFRTRLRSKSPEAEEIDGVYYDFRLAAENGVIGYGFCYRFYGGRYGSYTVHEDDAMRKRYPDRLGPFSLALLGEASFDPFSEGEVREKKLRRLRALTIPDYPRR